MPTNKLSRLKGGIRLFGPHIGRAGLVSFLLKEFMRTTS